MAIAELARPTKAAGRPLASNELPLQLYVDLLHHFGGVQQARRAANLPDPPWPRKWTQRAVLAELRRLHRSGVTIRHADLERSGREDLWDEDRVLEDILERAETGQPLAYSKAPTALVGAGARYFGTWAQAIAAAGILGSSPAWCRRGSCFCPSRQRWAASRDTGNTSSD